MTLSEALALFKRTYFNRREREASTFYSTDSNLGDVRIEVFEYTFLTGTGGVEHTSWYVNVFRNDVVSGTECYDDPQSAFIAALDIAISYLTADITDTSLLLTDLSVFRDSICKLSKIGSYLLCPRCGTEEQLETWKNILENYSESDSAFATVRCCKCGWNRAVNINSIRENGYQLWLSHRYDNY